MKKNNKTYDKASWHIDGGEDSTDVINRFKDLFAFLDEKGMLTADGKEILEFGIDSSVSVNNTMVTDEGEEFLDRYYDNVLNKNPREVKINLEKEYMRFLSDN